MLADPTTLPDVLMAGWNGHYFAVPALVTAMSGTFVCLFAYDVHRSRRAEGTQPVERMLSEIAFNAVLGASMCMSLGAVLLKLVGWLAVDASWSSLLAAIAACTFLFAALRTAMHRADAIGEYAIPDFMRCDGDFELVPGETSPIGRWCGWLRFEGHGTCRITPTEESPHMPDHLRSPPLTCVWHAHGAGVLRIVVPEEGRPARVRHSELFVRRGEERWWRGALREVVELSLTEQGAPVCRLAFVPEDEEPSAPRSRSIYETG